MTFSPRVLHLQEVTTHKIEEEKKEFWCPPIWAHASFFFEIFKNRFYFLQSYRFEKRLNFLLIHHSWVKAENPYQIIIVDSLYCFKEVFEMVNSILFNRLLINNGIPAVNLNLSDMFSVPVEASHLMGKFQIRVSAFNPSHLTSDSPSRLLSRKKIIYVCFQLTKSSLFLQW